MPIAAEAARWANSGSAGNVDEQRKATNARVQVASSRGGETNSSSPANTFEQRLQQAV